MVPEEELVKGCLKGDAHCHRMLYQQYAAKMLTVCLRYGNTRQEAEDILHEGFIIVFEKLHQFKMLGSLEGWIRKIMVNKCIQSFNDRSKMFPVIDIEYVENSISSTDDVLSHLGFNQLIEMVQELPPVYKMVFNLYVFERMSHKEIAENLGIAVGTSKSNLSDARTLLKKKIEHSMLVAMKKIQ
jgi:RNA polymerase sigma-70 factor, ECF subfamily